MTEGKTTDVYLPCLKYFSTEAAGLFLGQSVHLLAVDPEVGLGLGREGTLGAREQLVVEAPGSARKFALL